jgi:hypothetical protein
MRKLFILLFLLSSSTVWAQQQPKVVMHLQSADTLVYRSVVGQINNLKKEFPDIMIEVVCNGPGMGFLLNENARYANRIEKMKYKDVELVGCEYSMAQRNIKREAMVPFAKTVPHGIAEIIRKQQDNWMYVKLGY